MKRSVRLACTFSGWFDADVEAVNLQDNETGEIKTAAEWLKLRGNIDGLILEDFGDAYAASLDGAFETLDLENDDVTEVGRTDENEAEDDEQRF